MISTVLRTYRILGITTLLGGVSMALWGCLMPIPHSNALNGVALEAFGYLAFGFITAVHAFVLLVLLEGVRSNSLLLRSVCTVIALGIATAHFLAPEADILRGVLLILGGLSRFFVALIQGGLGIIGIALLAKPALLTPTD